MKLLCLHGYGTSALIFEQQMRSIMDALGKEHEYVFLDGDFPVGQSGIVQLAVHSLSG